MLLKILGAIDIFSALIIIFNIYNIHWIITTVHVIVLFVKGITSLISDAPGVVMGLTDIMAALFIYFAVTGLLPIKIILFIVLVGKGAYSLA
ncbi:MAG: hypothetical protein HY514_03475 [Candidatus Aenigmarchaeota archaeon]|nr:hypothetical protein [Candidatus Aenigmarchaeota archaeon]